MIWPRVSCLCPTFSRIALLEEALESFLRQDYPGYAELIICNDYHRQQIHFDHPRVRVINLPKRCPDLGSKRNKTASYASGEWFITWGDDDIHLPPRISRVVKFVLDNGLRFCLEGPHFVLGSDGIKLKSHATAGAHIVSRNFYYELGGIPALSLGEDVSFNDLVRKREGCLPVCSAPPAFIYRWSSERPHISAQRSNNYERMLEHAEALVMTGKEPVGSLTLQPRWHQDWTKLANRLST